MQGNMRKCDDMPWHEEKCEEMQCDARESNEIKGNAMK